MCPGSPRCLFTGFGRRHGRRAVVRVCRWVWMVVRFVRVIRVPACARVSRVSCPWLRFDECVPCVSRLPPVSFYRYKTAVLAPEVSLFRHAAQHAKAARKVTLPSAALREVAQQRHGKRRSWPCTACAPPQESVSPNSKGKFEQSSACQSPSNSRLS